MSKQRNYKLEFERRKKKIVKYYCLESRAIADFKKHACWNPNLFIWDGFGWVGHEIEIYRHWEIPNKQLEENGK